MRRKNVRTGYVLVCVREDGKEFEPGWDRAWGRHPLSTLDRPAVWSSRKEASKALREIFGSSAKDMEIFKVEFVAE